MKMWDEDEEEFEEDEEEERKAAELKAEKDRKSAGTEISGGKRNSQRIGSVYTGNLTDNTIVTIQINQNQRRTAFVAA
jgi:hypothetical protein